MFELDLGYSVILILCLLAACSFEFVNGFHDTANAVATVIYTNSLKPWVAVILSGICNFGGVFIGGVSVAVGIINLLPVETLVDQNIAHSLSMVMALLITAISWNLLTWYLGIPCSSSHTLIGSIIGVGLAYSLLPGGTPDAVNWGKAQDIGLALLVSPLFGFSMAIILMFIIRSLTKKTEMGDSLFKEPKKNQPPPLWLRCILIVTCASVSAGHGANDGQKGVGLMMLILIGVVPAFFALNASFNPSSIEPSLKRIEQITMSIDSSVLSAPDREKLYTAKLANRELQGKLVNVIDVASIPKAERFEVRKSIMLMDRYLKDVSKKPEVKISEADKDALKRHLGKVREDFVDYSPTWVLVLISISLGVGTTIGWKRIVKTVGEKIGKEHLTYAQGGSAEIIAASTIALATKFGWPVSTTHVLSSGIAGSMVASKGVKNLQPDTIRNILIAWLLTLPVVVVMAGTLFLLFRTIF